MSNWKTLLYAVLLSTAYLHAQTGSTVLTDRGNVQGVQKAGVEYFKGIPFAAPPVGELRWRAPQPPKNWTVVHKADSFSPDCMQASFRNTGPQGQHKISEDCLYLNIWRPASASQNSKLPVMIWIHGGGFVNGGSSDPSTDGTSFARSGVVLVTFNYRLGRFGFFGFPELTRLDPDHLLGNYAFMDQIEAMRWVQHNIAAFGGDPSNVTIFGESAGGIAAHVLLTSPLTKGLFSRAIIESGWGRTGLGDRRYLSTSFPDGPASAESVGVEFAKSVGIEGTGAEALNALRRLPAEAVAGTLNMATMNQPGYTGPMIDGRLAVDDPDAVYAAGGGWKVPVIVGSNSFDVGFSSVTSKEALFSQFQSDRDVAAAAYDPDGNAQLADVKYAVAMDLTMTEPARYVARNFTARGAPAYIFRFSYRPMALRSKMKGAPHATEVPYVFNTIGANPTATPEDRATAQTMMSYWVAFAKNGEPNPAGLPPWPRYSTGAETILDFSESGPIVESDPWKKRLDAIEIFQASSSALAAAEPHAKP